MVEILDRDRFIVQKRSTSLQHTIPSNWADICGLKPKVETEAGLLHSEKYGYHLGIWRKDNQPEGGEADTFEERLARDFTRHTKILLRELDRATVHELIDMAADEIIHQETGDGEIQKKPETRVDREFGETRENIVEELTGE